MQPTTLTDIGDQLRDIQSFSHSMSALAKSGAALVSGDIHHTLNLLAAGSELISGKAAAASQSLGD